MEIVFLEEVSEPKSFILKPWGGAMKTVPFFIRLYDFTANFEILLPSSISFFMTAPFRAAESFPRSRGKTGNRGPLQAKRAESFSIAPLDWLKMHFRAFPMLSNVKILQL